MTSAMTQNGAAQVLYRLSLTGDSEAWGLLVERWGEALWKTAWATTGERTLAEDALQDALLAIRLQAGQFRGGGSDPDRSAVSWMQRVVATCGLMARRRRRDEMQRLLPLGHDPDRLPAHDPAPSESDPQLAELIRAELAGLPEAQRLAVTLRCVVGCEYGEIASAAGCTQTAARIRVYRGLKALRRSLERQGISAGGGLALACCVRLGEAAPDCGTQLTRLADGGGVIGLGQPSAAVLAACAYGGGVSMATIVGLSVGGLAAATGLAGLIYWLAVGVEGGSVAILSPSTSATTDDEAVRKTDMTIFAPGQDAAAISVLTNVLRPGKPGSVRIAGTLRQALEFRSDMLVLHMVRSSRLVLDPEMIGALRERKIIGIGRGAGDVFDALGLEIGSRRSAGIGEQAREIQIEAGMGSSMQKKGSKLLAAYSADDQLAIHLPRMDEATQFVDAIARLPGDENYAPIVKQGNYIFVGLTAPPPTWTDEYKLYFADLVNWLVTQDVRPFARANWQVTRCGEHAFGLAQHGSTTDLSGRDFHLRFSGPTTFSVTLQHSGSENVMLIFQGENREHWTRKDAKNGEDIRIEAEITEEDIRHVGDGYWSLRITNFDRAHTTACTLRIQAESRLDCDS